MKTLTKVLAVLMIVFMLVSVAQPIVFAAGAGIQAGDLANIKATAPSDQQTEGLKNMASNVLGIIQVATVILAVILIAVFGFKFVLGSAQEKADYQKSFIPLIVGVVVVFAASSIAKLIMNVATGV